MGSPVEVPKFLEYEDGGRDRREPEDDLVLVPTVMLLVLHDKLSGEAHENLRPHLEFLDRFFATEMRSSCISSIAASGTVLEVPISDSDGIDDQETWSSECLFHHSEFLYNDLLVAIASRRPTLSKYRAGDFNVSESSKKNQGNSRFYFPALISRIVNVDGELSIEAFDEWDGGLDWMPSFCHKEPDNSFIDLDENIFGRSDYVTEPINRWPEESRLMSEIYRDAGKAFLLQRLRLSWQAENSPPYLKGKREGKIQLFVSRILRKLTMLPSSSKYENAILWPIGIIAPEISEAEDRACVLSRIRTLEARFGMEVFLKFRMGLQDAWGATDDSSGAMGGNYMDGSSFVGTGTLLL